MLSENGDCVIREWKLCYERKAEAWQVEGERTLLPGYRQRIGTKTKIIVKAKLGEREKTKERKKSKHR